MLATPGSACFDVFSSRSVTLELGVRRKIETDFGLKLPMKYVAKLLPRFAFVQNIYREFEGNNDQYNSDTLLAYYW